MTTSTTEPGQVNLSASNGSAPKRRGRPPGSKNKPKTSTAKASTVKRGRPRKTTTAAKPAVSTTATAETKMQAVWPPREAHAILIEDSGLIVLNSNGDAYSVTAPVIVDRRSK